jgi:type IV pilus assembly protein PilQ
MMKIKRSGGLLFLALLAVYSVGAAVANGVDGSGSADPFDSNSSAATQPADEPANAPPPKITPAEGGTFSMQINNEVPLVEVLRMIGSQAQVSIVPSKEVRGTVPAMDLYNVTVPEALDAILSSNGYAYEQRGNIVFVLSEKEMEDRKKRDLETDVYRLYYINASDAATVLKSVLSEEGKISQTPATKTGTGSGSASGGGGSSGGTSGGATSGSSGGGSSGGASIGGNDYAAEDVIVVTDHPENQERVRQVIKEIDRRPKQVLVEATILEAELTENNQLGINFTALGSINFDDLGTLPIGGGIGPQILSTVTGSSSATSDVPKGFSTKGFNAIQTGQGGLQVGIVQDNIAIFLNALESVTNTSVLSNPKVLTLDKQPGYVHIGETIYYTGQTTQNDQSTTAAVQSIDTGITLTFRPYVGDDGMIRMEIDPNDSTPVGSGTTVGSTFLPPNLDTNEVSSNIMVKDGQTVLIGGLFRDNNSVKKAQVPFFGNLPLVGPLFGQQADSTDRNEIIFLLTPHVVKDDAVFDSLSQAAMKDAEKLRVGVRRDMLPWGRERLAESCYEGAQTELAKPHPDLNLVRWHLDCAINLNPMYLEAIDLREKITGQVVTTADNSSIRSFVRREIMAEDAAAPNRPPEETPPRQTKVISLRPVLVRTTQPLQ